MGIAVALAVTYAAALMALFPPASLAALMTARATGSTGRM